MHFYIFSQKNRFKKKNRDFTVPLFPLFPRVYTQHKKIKIPKKVKKGRKFALRVDIKIGRMGV